MELPLVFQGTLVCLIYLFSAKCNLNALWNCVILVIIWKLGWNQTMKTSGGKLELQMLRIKKRIFFVKRTLYEVDFVRNDLI